MRCRLLMIQQGDEGMTDICRGSLRDSEWNGPFRLDFRGAAREGIKRIFVSGGLAPGGNGFCSVE